MSLSQILTGSQDDEAVWVEGELIRNLMAAARSTQYTGAIVVPVFFGVGYGVVPLPWLLAWCTGALALWAYRIWIGVWYARHVARADTAAHIAFIRRFSHSWPLSAFWWGLSTFMFFDRTPLVSQFICWLIIAGMGAYSLNSFSSYLPIMRSYVNSLVLTVMMVIVVRVIELKFQGPTFHYWLLLLAIVQWQLLIRGGTRLNETYRRNFELLYRNNLLIRSLTRQTQAALDAVAVKNRFLANATHDIRQPVHALALYADWLRDEPELVREIAPKIVEATQAVNRLFDSLFDLARLDAGQVRMNTEVIDISRLLHDLDLQYQPLARARGLEFRVRGVAGTIVSDRIRLQRILGNFISNAIKYTPRGGVLLAARRTARGVRFEVWDTGIGIAGQHLGEIFREFYKVPAHTGTEDGFGLGLAIVSRLAHAMGHRVGVRSRVGRGSVFTLTLDNGDASLAPPARMPL